MVDDPTRTVVAEPLSDAAWARYGWVPRPDTDPGDGEHTLHFEWDDAHLNTIEHRTDEVDTTGAGLRCAVMYRHETHTQVLTPLDAASMLAVAPASSTFDSPADLEDVRAFVLQPGETIVLHRGTWHWGPFPIGGATSVRFLNVQGRRYADDNASIDLTARTGYVVEVVSP